MIWLIILILLVSIFDVRYMLQRGEKRELVVYAFLAVGTLVFGIYYFSDPYRDSLAKNILEVLNLKY